MSPTSSVPSFVTYLLSYPGSPRLNDTENYLKNEFPFTYETIFGVSKNDISQETLRHFVPSYQNLIWGKIKKISAGELACHIGHWKCLQAFLKTPMEYALVLEDDVRFSVDFLKFVNSDFWKKFDIFFLSSSHDPYISNYKNRLLENRDAYKLFEVQHGLLDTTARFISRKAAQQLVERMFPMLRLTDQYDHIVSDLKYGFAQPHLCYEPPSTVSVIECFENERGMSIKKRTLRVIFVNLLEWFYRLVFKKNYFWPIIEVEKSISKIKST